MYLQSLSCQALSLKKLKVHLLTTLFPFPFYTKSLNPFVSLSIIYPENPSALFHNPINMNLLHPSIRNTPLSLRSSIITAQYKTCLYFQKLGTNSRETFNFLFKNQFKNLSNLPKRIPSFQINRNRTSEDIQRYSY